MDKNENQNESKQTLKDNIIVALLSLLSLGLIGLGTSHIAVLQEVKVNTNKIHRNEAEINSIKKTVSVDYKELNQKLNDIDKKLEVLIQKSK